MAPKATMKAIDALIGAPRNNRMLFKGTTAESYCRTLRPRCPPKTTTKIWIWIRQHVALRRWNPKLVAIVGAIASKAKAPGGCPGLYGACDQPSVN